MTNHTSILTTPTGIDYSLRGKRNVFQLVAAVLTPYQMYIGHVFIGYVHAADIVTAQQIARDVTGDDTAEARFTA